MRGSIRNAHMPARASPSRVQQLPTAALAPSTRPALAAAAFAAWPAACRHEHGHGLLVRVRIRVRVRVRVRVRARVRVRVRVIE